MLSNSSHAGLNQVIIALFHKNFCCMAAAAHYGGAMEWKAYRAVGIYGSGVCCKASVRGIDIDGFARGDSAVGDCAGR